MAKKILLLDSDSEYLRSVSRLLESQGHMVATADDVLACLDQLVEFVPDVAFVDLSIPRIGGDDFCRIIRNIDYLQQCYLVLVAGAAGCEELDLQALGINACFSRGSATEMTSRVLEIIEAAARREEVPVQPSPPERELRRVQRETRELLARNRALRMILESMSQGIIELFADRVVYVNPQALAFLGLGLGKVLGRPVATIFPEPLWLQIAPLLSGSRPVRAEEDRYLPVWLHGRHLLIDRLPARGNAESRILLISDVTEIRRMESVVEAANLMDKLGAVFSGIRHELVNPINSLKLALTVLQHQLQDCDREVIAGFIAGCLEDVSRLEYLLTALKNYSLFESPVLQPVEIGTFFERFTPLVSDEFSRRRITLQVTGVTGGDWVMADPRALHHVLLNLLTNAMDAVGDRRDGLVAVNAGRAGNWVEIRVEDNGCGMDNEALGKLFRPFLTSKEKGTGLGLVIVNRIVSRMNGRLEVSSRKGAGTVFTIVLPAADARRQPPGKVKAKAARRQSGADCTGAAEIGRTHEIGEKA